MPDVLTHFFVPGGPIHHFLVVVIVVVERIVQNRTVAVLVPVGGAIRGSVVCMAIFHLHVVGVVVFDTRAIITERGHCLALLRSLLGWLKFLPKNVTFAKTLIVTAVRDRVPVLITFRRLYHRCLHWARTR